MIQFAFGGILFSITQHMVQLHFAQTRSSNMLQVLLFSAVFYFEMLHSVNGQDVLVFLGVTCCTVFVAAKTSLIHTDGPCCRQRFFRDSEPGLEHGSVSMSRVRYIDEISFPHDVMSTSL